jgi:hypothetical protein
MKIPFTFSKILFLILILSFFSCNLKEDQNLESTKTIESEGIQIDVSANYSGKFKSGIAIGSPHAPIAIPYLKYEESFLITIQPANREPYFVEYDANQLDLKDSNSVEKSLQNIQLLFSQSTEHLLYQGKLQQKDTTLVIHYLDKKYPFVSPYFDKTQSIENPNWKDIPDVMSLAAQIIKDTSNYYNDIYNIKTFTLSLNENTFWEALKKLPRENNLDYLVLNEFNIKPSNTDFLSFVCSTWNERSSIWKNKVAERLKKYYNDIERNNLKANYEAVTCITTIIDSSKEVNLKKEYLNFLVNNFEKKLVNAFGSIIQSTNDYDKTFISTHSDLINSRCLTLLDKNNPQIVNAILYVSDFLQNKSTYNKAIEKAITLWPEYPLDQSVNNFYYVLNEKQKAFLLEKAQLLWETTSGNVEASQFLESHADCTLLRMLNKKYPTKTPLSVDFGCKN